MFAVTDALAGKELANVERTFKDRCGRERLSRQDEIKLLMPTSGRMTARRLST